MAKAGYIYLHSDGTDRWRLVKGGEKEGKRREMCQGPGLRGGELTPCGRGKGGTVVRDGGSSQSLS